MQPAGVGRASAQAEELASGIELGSRAGGARRLDGGVRWAALSVGPAARGIESGAAESDRADAAQRACATGVSRLGTPMAVTASRPRPPDEAGEAGQARPENEADSAATVTEPSVAAKTEWAWGRSIGAGSERRNGRYCWRGGLRPEAKQITKGTFSRELNKGHF